MAHIVMDDNPCIVIRRYMSGRKFQIRLFLWRLFFMSLSEWKSGLKHGEKLKVIRCKNLYLDESGRSVECGRIIAILTDLQIDILRIDEEKPVFRCPKCSAEDRWIEIGFNNEKKLVFKIMDKHPEFSIADNLQYDEVEIIHQVG